MNTGSGEVESDLFHDRGGNLPYQTILGGLSKW